jgi:hypothetical protein
VAIFAGELRDALITHGEAGLGRGLPGDIRQMIASLLSKDNRWVNGRRIEVSDGMFV